MKTAFFSVTIVSLFVIACKPETQTKQNKPASTNPPATAAQQQQQQQQPPVQQAPAQQQTVQNTPQQQSFQPAQQPPIEQPVAQQQHSGAYAVLYGNIGSKLEAEDNIRVLRAQRVNCFIHETADKQYGVLVGPFRNYSEASKQMGRLQERGIENLSLYPMAK